MTKAASRSTGWRLVAILLVVTMAGCMREELRSFRGVTEGEVVRLAAPVTGNLSSLNVEIGATV